jgi:hypothetical protein
MGDTAPETRGLKAFIQHQKKAVKEAGKAFASLIPEGVREHSIDAVKTSAEGFSILKDAAKDEVQKGLDRIRTTRNSPKRKVKIEVNEEELR